MTGRSQQHQKQRAIGLVPGGGPAALRSQHDGAAVGRAQAPAAGPATLSQLNFERAVSAVEALRIGRRGLACRDFVLMED
jgi:hypothetical protein